MKLEVTRKSISQVLLLLNQGEWQIPLFQRDFVWNSQQVKELLYSIIKSHPIGLITLWEQPQNDPHTPGEPIKLKDAEFRKYQKDPAVIKLILDGKQRLTVLAMAFGGLSTPNDRFSFSGQWFIDLNKMTPGFDDDNFIIYKKQRQVIDEKLNHPAICVAKGIIPLKDYENFGKYLANIHNQEYYDNSELPPLDVRENRVNNVNLLNNTFSQFQIPIAEIPSEITLGEVCEIFNVLNTTGTKVSTFDLLHNKLFSLSNSKFSLRENFNDHTDLDNLSYLLTPSRQEFYCQLITGCYIFDKQNQSQSKKIESIKGGDLIETPLIFYENFERNILKIDTYTADLFKNIFGTHFQLNEIPYPVQTLLYFALRWHMEMNSDEIDFNTDELNKIFRAFFWRNTLNERYDQGFLTQFTTDLKTLNTSLSKISQHRGTEQWKIEANKTLNDLVGDPLPKEKILEHIMNGDIRGAIRQLLYISLYTNVTLDLVSGEKLSRFTEERKKKVQLHHIFPRDWCKNNKGKYPELLNDLSILNNAANLIPLTSYSNNNWKANSPSTAINRFNLDYTSKMQLYKSLFIDLECFNALKNDELEEFWEIRSNLLATAIYENQIVV